MGRNPERRAPSTHPIFNNKLTKTTTMNAAPARTPTEIRALAEKLGPAEKLLDLIINFPDHLWHNRPGVVVNGKWRPATKVEVADFHREQKQPAHGEYRQPGPNPDAIERVYLTFGEIWQANPELAARLASYIMTETDWRDMKVVSAAFMLVQSRRGDPVIDESNGVREVLFHDEDYRDIGEAMLKFYVRGSNRMMNPKLIQRVGEVLALPGVVEANRIFGFGNAHKRKPFLGRYEKAVADWLNFRESNPTLLEGLAKAGFAGTVRTLSRKVGYKPKSPRYFEVLRWPQKQHADGHRKIGLDGLNIVKLSFQGMTEAEICQRIVDEELGYKQTIGMLPPEIGLTPAIFVALLDQLSDKDLVILTPTLEEFGLLEHAPIQERWKAALASQEDQRSRNIAKNVKNRQAAQALETAADQAVVKVVQKATAEADVHLMFIIDASGSMEGAIDQSKEALTHIVQGFPVEKLHIASFDTVGQILRLRHASAAGVAHMLSPVKAGGGTSYSSAITAFQAAQVRIPDGAELIVFAVGDEQGEAGENFALTIRKSGYRVSAFAHVVNVCQNWGRGQTVRRAAEVLSVPYLEVNVAQLCDVYQVQRTLRAVLEATPFHSRMALVEKILATPLLVKPY